MNVLKGFGCTMPIFLPPVASRLGRVKAFTRGAIFVDIKRSA